MAIGEVAVGSSRVLAYLGFSLRVVGKFRAEPLKSRLTPDYT